MPVNWRPSIGGLQRHVSTLFFIHIPYNYACSLEFLKLHAVQVRRCHLAVLVAVTFFWDVNAVPPWWITVVSEFPPVIYCTLTEVFLTLTEVFPCFFLSCKANARVKLAKTGRGPHSSTLVCICVVRFLFVLFYVWFVCKCILPPGDKLIVVNKYIILETLS